MDFTQDQKKAIEEHTGNVLVSAAAGSGKTAVLTERIVNMVLSQEADIDIDRILVVTFAVDAAAEMKSRIADKLAEFSYNNPDNLRVKRQLNLIHNAQICTIDSFCNYIVANHADEIGLDPSIQIATNDSLAMLMSDALEEVIAEHFENMTDDFSRVVECYAPKGDIHNSLTVAINDIYNVAASQPFFDRYIEKEKINCRQTADDIVKTEWFQKIVVDEDKIIDKCLEVCKRVYEEAKNCCHGLDYVDMFENDISTIMLCRNTPFEDRKAKADFCGKPNINNICKKYSGDMIIEAKDYDEKIKSARAVYKKILDECLKAYHNESVADKIDKIIKTNDVLYTLLCLTEEYYKKVSEAKKENGIMDFNDLEHYALSILVNPEDYSPTETALSYRDYFKEILIDEYQDSSIIQEIILSSISKSEEINGTRFMVGDVKQSIYGFRMARPDIFIEKYSAYRDEPGDNRRIVLSQNFRSRREVIDSVNVVFENIMIKEVGGIDYDANQHLYLGADYPQNDGDINKSEFIKYTFEKGGRFKSVGELDATVIAQRIKELVGNFPVYDKKLKKMRPCEYRDIAVLYRSTRGQDIIIKKVFDEYSIPVSISTKNGYFDAPEIKLILNYLQLLSNIRVDIPLYGVLHSEAFGNVTENDFGDICIGKKRNELLIDKIYDYIAAFPECEVTKKINRILEDVKHFGKLATYMSPDRLIEEICLHYSYFDYVSILPAGPQRLANVKMLINVAKEYGASSFSGFYDFSRYIEELRERDSELGEANIEDETKNVVRVMTMHKSKGLEFPVCILGQMDKNLEVSGGFVSNKIVAHSEYGVGIKYIDLENRAIETTLKYDIIKAEKSRFERGEAVRVLYVAMTRAKEKLIMTGNISEKDEEKLVSELDEEFSEDKIEGVKNYLQILLHVAYNNSEYFSIYDYTEKALAMSEGEQINTAVKKAGLLNVKAGEEPLMYAYPHKDINMLYNKTTVSELKKAAFIEREDGELSVYADTFEKTVPCFIAQNDNEIGGAERGSAYHRVMELIDYKSILEGNIGDNLKRMRASWVSNYNISAREDSLVAARKVEAFLNTELAGRMSAADKAEKLFREQPFVMGVDSHEVNKDCEEGQMILVQGVVDVYFEEDGELVLLDYKTDKVDDKEELIKRYITQIDYYEEALERLLHKKVKERLLYSFALNEVIVL